MEKGEAYAKGRLYAKRTMKEIGNEQKRLRIIESAIMDGHWKFLSKESKELWLQHHEPPKK